MVTEKQCLYSIIFNGELLVKTRRKHALEIISRFTNIHQDELQDTLFSIKPIIITQTADHALAREYVLAFRDAGLDVQLQAFQPEHDNITNVELSFGHYAPLERAESSPNYVVDISSEEDPQDSQTPVQLARPKYTVVFEGALNRDCTRRQAVNNLLHLCKTTENEVLENIFSVVPVIICRSNDRHQADKYISAFSDAGLKLEMIEDCTDCDDMVVSSLKIRNDAPQVPVSKPVSRFTYALMAISFTAITLWVYVYISFPGLFVDNQPAILNIELANVAEPETSSEPEVKTGPGPEPAPAPKPDKKPKPELMPKSKPGPEAVSEKTISPVQPPKIIKPEKPASQAEVGKPLAPVVNNDLRQVEDDYFLVLLNWLVNSTRSQHLNLEGEIRIRLTITRDGKLTGSQVLSSSSDRLTRITLDRAQAASPYPAIPAEIAGEAYSFVLPFKYELQ